MCRGSCSLERLPKSWGVLVLDLHRGWGRCNAADPLGRRFSGDLVLRVDFPGYSGEDSLEEISWDEFFEKFDQENLEFLYQDETKDGGESRFCKFVSSQKPR